MKFALFRRQKDEAVIDRLHGEIMAAARQPALYLDFGVADTFDGRFEALALVATPPVLRLASLPAPGPDLAQRLTDAIFTRFDDALRQTGISDVAVPKRMQKLAAAWLGRRQAYAGALAAADDGPLREAIARNVYAGSLDPGAPAVRSLARYFGEIATAQERAGLDDYINGPAPLPPVTTAGVTP